MVMNRDIMQHDSIIVRILRNTKCFSCCYILNFKEIYYDVHFQKLQIINFVFLVINYFFLKNMQFRVFYYLYFTHKLSQAYKILNVIYLSSDFLLTYIIIQRIRENHRFNCFAMYMLTVILSRRGKSNLSISIIY
jgi:hypothetical protein